MLLTKAKQAKSAEALVSRGARGGARRPGHARAVVFSEDAASIAGRQGAYRAGRDGRVLMGKSGVGKSSLVNPLVGDEVQATGAVRAGDGKGRHTTVSREIKVYSERRVARRSCRACAAWSPWDSPDAGIDAGVFLTGGAFAAQCRFS